jgi:hypothetical protein
VADVSAGVTAGFDEGNEVFDEFFEENVIFPECVVRVDEQSVSSHAYSVDLSRNSQGTLHE